MTAEKFIRLFKDKTKKGIIDRVVDNYTIIVKDLFNKEVDIQMFLNQEVVLSNGQTGKIEGAFGKSGKIRVTFKDSLTI